MMVGKPTVKIGEAQTCIGRPVNKHLALVAYPVILAEKIFHIFSREVLHKTFIIGNKFSCQTSFPIL